MAHIDSDHPSEREAGPTMQRCPHCGGEHEIGRVAELLRTSERVRSDAVRARQASAASLREAVHALATEARQR